MDSPFVAAGAFREIEFQLSLLRVISPGSSPAPQTETLEQLLSVRPDALVPRR